MKKSFLNLPTPPIVAMIQCKTEKECIEKINRSLKAGAEAFGIQLCRLEESERTEEKLTKIFSACKDLPIYVTSYRAGTNEKYTDGQCAEVLLRALKAGATLCDVRGDMFDENIYQITKNEQAVKKQKELIEDIHKSGGEVLISTHDFRELSADEIFGIAKLQAEHGADVIKIVVKSENIKMLPEYIKVIQKVKNELKKPFLFLDVGACSNILRKIGGELGSCMYLCVESHGELDTPAQPTIKKVLQIRNAMEK